MDVRPVKRIIEQAPLQPCNFDDQLKNLTEQEIHLAEEWNIQQQRNEFSYVLWPLGRGNVFQRVRRNDVKKAIAASTGKGCIFDGKSPSPICYSIYTNNFKIVGPDK